MVVKTLQIVQSFEKKLFYYDICWLLAINLFRPLFLMYTRPHRISRLTFLFYSLNLLHKVTYIFWALTWIVSLPSYTAFVLSFCSSSQDFDTHFLHFHLMMDSLCFSMRLEIYTSATDFHRLVKQHAYRTIKRDLSLQRSIYFNIILCFVFCCVYF